MRMKIEVQDRAYHRAITRLWKASEGNDITSGI
jgi:hypothetical protein